MVRLLTNLIEKKRFEKLHKPKAPLCRSEGGKPPTNLPAAKFALPTKSGEGLFLDKRRLFVAIPPSRQAVPPPFTQGRLGIDLLCLFCT